MKTLSIKQPWASLIAHGLKDIENRSWRTKYRGKFLIHASAKAFMGRGHSLTAEQLSICKENYKKGILPNLLLLPASAIIGEVTLVDCVINHPSIWAEKGFLCDNGRGYKDIWNWVLENPILYDEPILNVKGKLSFWEFNK